MEHKKGWMAKQVAETQSALKNSPEWVLKLARFEGSDRHEIIQAEQGDRESHETNQGHETEE